MCMSRQMMNFFSQIKIILQKETDKNTVGNNAKNFIFFRHVKNVNLSYISLIQFILNYMFCATT